jgi:DNA-binding Lrp family transcriptional regulator
MVKYKLDWKDRKILKELDSNARLSSAKIAEKTRISKQVVNYRINTMMHLGIIKEFMTFISSSKIGYTFYDIFFKVKRMTKEREKEIIQNIKDLEGVGWFVSSDSEWKLAVCILAKTHEELKVILDKVMLILGNDTLDHEMFIVIDAFQLPQKKFYHEKRYGPPSYFSRKDKLDLKDFDKEVLRILANNARTSRMDIAKKLKTTLEKVRYSMKRMEQQGIIQSYKPLLDTNKLGLLWHILLIQFNHCSNKKKNAFIEFIISSNLLSISSLDSSRAVTSDV